MKAHRYIDITLNLYKQKPGRLFPDKYQYTQFFSPRPKHTRTIRTTTTIPAGPKMSTQKSILIVGLAPPKTSTTSDPHLTPENAQKYGSPTTVANTIQSQIQSLKAANYDIQVKLVDPSNYTATLDDIKATLASKHWDGFNVGFGVRGTPEYTEVFELLVNAAREVAPGTKMSFNSRPDNLFESVVRNHG